MKLDYTIESPEKRLALVNQILLETPNPSPQYLEILANYLILCMEKQERKNKKILTDNRLVTINARETSLEGLMSQFENGENGIYNLTTTSSPTAIFRPKVEITKQDLADIPPLAQLRDSITRWEAARREASGVQAYAIKRALIEMRKDQYIIKNAYCRPIIFNKISHGSLHPLEFPFNEYVNEERRPCFSGLSFLDPRIDSIILCNYSKLRESSENNIIDDTYYVMYDFTNLLHRALAPFPLYAAIVQYKIESRPNAEIQRLIEENFGFSYSLEYISSLWRNKIPKIIATCATREWLEWYYTTQERGLWKRCSCCGQIKLAHSQYFSVNKTSKDGWYSICKKCRNNNKKKGER